MKGAFVPSPCGWRRLALGYALATIAFAKGLGALFPDPHRHAPGSLEVLPAAAACLELALAIGLLTSRWRASAAGVFGLSIVFLALALRDAFVGPGGSCHCLGRADLSPAARFALIAGLLLTSGSCALEGWRSPDVSRDARGG